MKRIIPAICLVLLCFMMTFAEAEMATSIAPLSDFVKRFNEASYQNGTEHTIAEEQLVQLEGVKESVVYQVQYNPYEQLQLTLAKDSSDLNDVTVYYSLGAENESEVLADFDLLVREVLYASRLASNQGEELDALIESLGYTSVMSAEDSNWYLMPEGITIGYMKNGAFGIWFFIQIMG